MVKKKGERKKKAEERKPLQATPLPAVHPATDEACRTPFLLSFAKVRNIRPTRYCE